MASKRRTHVQNVDRTNVKCPVFGLRSDLVSTRETQHDTEADDMMAEYRWPYHAPIWMNGQSNELRRAQELADLVAGDQHLSED
jgi:hypothetical protein